MVQPVRSSLRILAGVVESDEGRIFPAAPVRLTEAQVAAPPTKHGRSAAPQPTSDRHGHRGCGIGPYQQQHGARLTMVVELGSPTVSDALRRLVVMGAARETADQRTAVASSECFPLARHRSTRTRPLCLGGSLSRDTTASCRHIGLSLGGHTAAWPRPGHGGR